MALNKTDKRILEGVLGGLGVIGAQFAKQPEVAVGIAFTSLMLSTTAIILDTWPAEEPMGTTPRLPFKDAPEAKPVVQEPTQAPILRFNLG